MKEALAHLYPEEPTKPHTGFLSPTGFQGPRPDYLIALHSSSRKATNNFLAGSTPRCLFRCNSRGELELGALPPSRPSRAHHLRPMRFAIAPSTVAPSRPAADPRDFPCPTRGPALPSRPISRHSNRHMSPLGPLSRPSTPKSGTMDPTSLRGSRK